MSTMTRSSDLLSTSATALRPNVVARARSTPAALPESEIIIAGSESPADIFAADAPVQFTMDDALPARSNPRSGLLAARAESRRCLGQMNHKTKEQIDGSKIKSREAERKKARAVSAALIRAQSDAALTTRGMSVRRHPRAQSVGGAGSLATVAAAAAAAVSPPSAVAPASTAAVDAVASRTNELRLSKSPDKYTRSPDKKGSKVPVFQEGQCLEEEDPSDFLELVSPATSPQKTSTETVPSAHNVGSPARSKSLNGPQLLKPEMAKRRRSSATRKSRSGRFAISGTEKSNAGPASPSKSLETKSEHASSPTGRKRFSSGTSRRSRSGRFAVSEAIASKPDPKSPSKSPDTALEHANSPICRRKSGSRTSRRSRSGRALSESADKEEEPIASPVSPSKSLQTVSEYGKSAKKTRRGSRLLEDAGTGIVGADPSSPRKNGDTPPDHAPKSKRRGSKPSRHRDTSAAKEDGGPLSSPVKKLDTCCDSTESPSKRKSARSSRRMASSEATELKETGCSNTDSRPKSPSRRRSSKLKSRCSPKKESVSTNLEVGSSPAKSSPRRKRPNPSRHSTLVKVANPSELNESATSTTSEEEEFPSDPSTAPNKSKSPSKRRSTKSSRLRSSEKDVDSPEGQQEQTVEWTRNLSEETGAVCRSAAREPKVASGNCVTGSATASPRKPLSDAKADTSPDMKRSIERKPSIDLEDVFTTTHSANDSDIPGPPQPCERHESLLLNDVFFAALPPAPTLVPAVSGCTNNDTFASFDGSSYDFKEMAPAGTKLRNLLGTFTTRK